MEKSTSFLYCLLFFLMFYSCEKRQQFPGEDKYGTKIFYNRKEYILYEMEHHNAKVIVVDTSCLNQKKKAVKDIELNNLTYFTNIGLAKNEFVQLLKYYGIKTKPIDPHGKREGRFVGCCYEYEMNEELERRHGEYFFDSIAIVARKMFVKKHPNEVLMENGIDLKTVYGK